MTSTAGSERAARAPWLTAAAVVLVAGYLLLRRRRAAVAALVVAAPFAPPDPPPDPTPDPVAPAHPGRERPLPTWVRASIVVVMLLAFFAVSLLATKQV